MRNFHVGPDLFTLESTTSVDGRAHSFESDVAAIFALFLERESEFGVHPLAVIDYPDIVDASNFGFLADAAAYAARRTKALGENSTELQIVVLTTYANIVQPSLEAAGFKTVHIHMPAGPDHTAAFMLDPIDPAESIRTLYIEAVNEHDEKIKPSFVLKLMNKDGMLCGGAYGSIHGFGGKRYAYLSTMTLTSGMPSGSGTALMNELVLFLRDQGVETVHVGTQTAGRFYERVGFKVEHRLVRSLRVRRQDGYEVSSDLVMLSRSL